MQIKFLVEEDFVNYKKPSMFIGFPTCDWKCEKSCGIKGICQNSELANALTFTVSNDSICNRYIENPISKSLVIGGLEPFDNWVELEALIQEFRNHTDDDIVIYTGYYVNEIIDKIDHMRQHYNNIIIKFGRFIPNQTPHYDEVLGVKLASDNQYAERIC
jgi:organic radical activating enzyme